MTVSAVDGAWRIVDGDRMTTLHGRDPQREADQVAAELLGDARPDALVVIGLGLGFLLEALERREWTGKVLALEPEPATVGPFRERRDWTAWTETGRLRVLQGPDFANAADCWRWLPADGTVKLYVNPVLERVRPREVERAREVLARIRFDAEANADARRRFAGGYLLNTLRNLPAIAAESDAGALVNAAPNVPALVVGAGPSLDAALDAIRDVRDSMLIVAADTALRPLLRAGVHPHVLVAVDPGESNARHLTDLPPCPDTFMVAEGSVDPLAIDGFRGRTFFFRVSDHEPWPWLRRAGRDAATLRAWGSVLTTAFDLALQMGCNPVVLAGADLAYPDGRPYSRGVTWEEDWARRAHWGEPIEQQWRESIDRWPLVWEPDIAGRPVRTAPHLVAFRQWLVDQTRRETSRRFVNASGAGILHGDSIEQIAPAALRRFVGSLPSSSAMPRGGPAACVRDRWRPAAGNRVLAAASALADGAASGEEIAEATLAAWRRFAPGVDRAAVADALQVVARHGACDSAGDMTPHGAPAVPAHAEVGCEVVWLQQLAAAMPLVPMPLAPNRLQVAPGGARLYRFRTTAARIICCALRPPEGAVAENMRPLARAVDLDHVVAGSYSVCRDEVHFRPGDDSDPRTNGRQYTLLVPPPVAYLESLPLDDVAAHAL